MGTPRRMNAPQRRTRAMWSVSLAAAVILLLSACAKSSSSGSTGSGVLGTRDIQGIGTVLDTSAGLTLYHLTTEQSGKIECTGSCATNWPPFLAPGGNAPTGTAFDAKLGTISRPDGGTQLTFDGMPLYRFAGDSSAGQANGQGIGGVWFAVTASGTPGSKGSGSGYGGGY